MAIIGQLNILDFLKSSSNASARELYTYLCAASENSSDIFKRIKNTQKECKYDLGEGMIAIEQSYYLKPESRAFFESHRKYVDVQLVVFGEEFFYLAPNEYCNIKQEYDSTKDLIIYNRPAIHSTIFLRAKSVAIFYPCDVHSGGMGLEILGKNNDTQSRVFKSVVKVPLELANNILLKG